MPRRKKQAGEPVNIDQVPNITDAQKITFTEQGYKPYITDSGKVKWLTDEHYIYKKVKHDSPKRLFTTNKMYFGNRRQRNPFKLFLRILLDNWVFTIVFLFILIFLVKAEFFISLAQNYF